MINTDNAIVFDCSIIQISNRPTELRYWRIGIILHFPIQQQISPQLMTRFVLRLDTDTA